MADMTGAAFHEWDTEDPEADLLDLLWASDDVCDFASPQVCTHAACMRKPLVRLCAALHAYPPPTTACSPVVHVWRAADLRHPLPHDPGQQHQLLRGRQ